MCKACKACAKVKACPDKVYIPWPKTDVLFGTVHIDYCDLGGTHLVVIIDACTKWLEVYQTPFITIKCTIESLRDCFARFGLPYTAVSDKATVFKFENMQKFFIELNILLLHPILHKVTAKLRIQLKQSKLTENSVKTVNVSLKAALDDPSNAGIDLSTILARLLITYRDTPHCVTKKSPAEMVFGVILLSIEPNTHGVSSQTGGDGTLITKDNVEHMTDQEYQRHDHKASKVDDMSNVIVDDGNDVGKILKIESRFCLYMSIDILFIIKLELHEDCSVINLIKNITQM
ncbi:hypothetical protein ILUMI_10856 [Ignelater luminosus]|uniref:Integrase catalytic domain-containing protein n=1 Tax=Ignelater luminosus TaxID=2038154 RepID=A0A8K0GEH8_IGNLU|nr:hypothetical protein ILUMI_10856 [Ignelater luminosus]